jgi:hypothetical protein
LLREALKSMGRSDLIGNGKHHLIPNWQPLSEGGYKSARRKNSTGAGAKSSVSLSTTSKRAGIVPKAQPKKGQLLTQHTGLPPRHKS